MHPQRHGLADRYLTGYHGIEIGASAHNGFGLDPAHCQNVDYSEDPDRPAAVEQRAHGYEPVPVDVLAEGDDLPWPDSTHDFVLSSHVLEHFPDPIKTLREWVRVVRPGGLLFLILPLPDAHPADRAHAVSTLEAIEAAHRDGWTVATAPVPEGHEPRGHYHRYSFRSFQDLIERHFAGVLEWIDGEPIDTKVGNGHCHVLRVIKPATPAAPRIDMRPKRLRVYINMPDDSGCTAYRQYAPYKHCRDALAKLGIDLIAGGPKGGSLPDASYDAYLFQRSTGPMGMALMHWIKRCRRRILWDLDDDFLAIPEWSPAYRAIREDGSLRMLPAYLDMADAITVTNRHLAARLEDEFEFTRGKIHIAPNLVDTDRYPAGGWTPRDGRPPRILWTGSDYHQADLELLVPVVARIVRETDWEMVFVGAMPEAVRHHPPGRVWQTVGAPVRYYPRLLAEIAPDVALAPLTGTLFDQSKSAIKWMECVLAGAAVVATDYGPYHDAIQHGETGLLVPVPNDPDVWFDAIGTALERRQELQAAARADVLAHHSWQSPEAKQTWIDYFVAQVVEAIAGGSAEPPPPRSSYARVYST